MYPHTSSLCPIIRCKFFVLDAFSMGKLHKDLATFMVETAEAEDSSDIQFIKVC